MKKRIIRLIVGIAVCGAIQFIMFLLYKYLEFGFFLYIICAIIVASYTIPYAIMYAFDDDS